MTPVETKSLHSRYNPQAEAERYVSALSLGDAIRFFILIEPGLGYLASPLRKRVPGAKVIALHVEKPSGELAAEGPDAEWYPETGISVQAFLEAEIPDSPAACIRLLEWRPALSVYGKACLALVEEAAEFIKRADANARTTKTFGRKWFRNFFRNLGLIKNVIYPAPLSLPFLVTGAGPALEDAIPLVREARGTGGLFIIAVSSSLAALRAGKLTPGMTISSDGTGWARFHLHEIFRGARGREKPCPLAVALTALLPSQCGNVPLLLISDGSLWQTLILKGLNIPFIALPQRGTVSASALDLAFALSDREVFFTGMDLANRDIRSHARPYSLDRFIEESAERLNPAYSQAYKRSSLLKAGGSYAIYASWFKKQLDLYPRRPFPLGKNNPVFDCPETAGTRAAIPERTPAGKAHTDFKIITYNGETGRVEKALALLENGLENPTGSAALKKELDSLLCPEEPSLSADELIRTVRHLAGSRAEEKHG